MNIEAHIYKTRDGEFAARISSSAGTVYANPSYSLEVLLLRIDVILTQYEARGDYKGSESSHASK